MGQHYAGSFSCFEFPKRGADVVNKAKAKSEKIKSKIEERQKRISDYCSKHGVDAVMLLSNMDQFVSYATQNGLNMTVGGIQALQADARQITLEKESLEKLLLIVRNLPHEQTFKLSFTDLEYLEF